MWFVNVSSACGFAISCVDAQGVTCCLLSLFSSARLASRRGGLASSLNILQVLRLLQNAAQACNL
jgi:hypothetical protein